jgi:hypothetical protein
MQPRFLKQLLASIDDEQYECIHFDSSGTDVLITDWDQFVSSVMPNKFEKVRTRLFFGRRLVLDLF